MALGLGPEIVALGLAPGILVPEEAPGISFRTLPADFLGLVLTGDLAVEIPTAAFNSSARARVRLEGESSTWNGQKSVPGRGIKLSERKYEQNIVVFFCFYRFGGTYRAILFTYFYTKRAFILLVETDPDPAELIVQNSTLLKHFRVFNSGCSFWKNLTMEDGGGSKKYQKMSAAEPWITKKTLYDTNQDPGPVSQVVSIRIHMN